MEAGGTAPISSGCFPLKGARGGLKLSLQRLRSKSNSTSSGSSRSPPPTRMPTSPSPSIRPHVKPAATAREDEEIRQVFRYFDGDDDGKISAVELRAYFGSIGEYMSHEEAQAVIDDFDSDRDGLIDMADFLRLMKRDKGDDNYMDDLKAAFQMFELHKGCGSITPKSLQRALSRLGNVISYDECKAMIQVFDTDGNGELDFHEFHRMMA